MRERYGLDRAPVGRFIVVAVIVAAFVGVLVMVGVFITRDEVEGRLLTWKVISPTRVDLRYSVTRPSGTAVTCVLRAQDRHRVDLGYATVELPASAAGSSETQIMDFALATLAPAYTVEVLGCADGDGPRVPGPQFPPGVVPPDQPAA